MGPYEKNGLAGVVFGIPQAARVSYLDLAESWTHDRKLLDLPRKNTPHQWVAWRDATSWSLGAQFWYDEIPSTRLGTRKALFSLGAIEDTDVVVVVSPMHSMAQSFKSVAGHYLKDKAGDGYSIVENFSLDLNRLVADGKHRDSIFGITGVTAEGYGLTFSSKIKGLWETYKPNVRSISIRQSGDFLTISDSFGITGLGNVEESFDNVAKILTGTFELVRGYLTIDNKSITPAPVR